MIAMLDLPTGWLAGLHRKKIGAATTLVKAAPLQLVVALE